MGAKLLIASVVLVVAYSASLAFGWGSASSSSSAHGGNSARRDLLIEVIGGKVKKIDTFSSDPYMSITVCQEKKETQKLKNTLNPVWNWKHQYKNVRDDCRLKFHLYDEETLKGDKTIGILETTVGQFLKERREDSTLTFGKKGDSNIQVKVKYV